jgi:hypothetical protein
MATVDGGLIVQSSAGAYLTLDGNGNVTGQLTASRVVPSWIGAQYALSTAGLASFALPPPGLAGTFAAISGGNHSGNNTAIQQVLTNQPQGSSDQVPAAGDQTNSNYNSIELLTNQAPDQIFARYIQTFDGAKGVNNTVVDTQGGPITAVGQTLTFTLHGIASLGQGAFSVRVKRFDPAAHTISVTTQKGHPLAGWRYWRVLSIGSNDVVIETGAVDKAAPGPLNYIGYYLGSSRQLKTWEDYLRFIQRSLNAKQGSIPSFNIVQGTWGFDKVYLSNNICQASSCY